MDDFGSVAGATTFRQGALQQNSSREADASDDEADLHVTRDPLCSRCGQWPARFYQMAILGALTIAEYRLCASCLEAEEAAAVLEPVPEEGDLSHLGPIQFDVLLRSLAEAEACEPREHLPGYEPLVRQIAQAHNQVIPNEVEACFARWRAS